MFFETQRSCYNEGSKGGATVFLDVKVYIVKANEQLQDNSFYQKPNVNPIAKHSEIVNIAMEGFKNQEPLSNSTASKLTVGEIRIHLNSILFPKCINLTCQKDL